MRSERLRVVRLDPGLWLQMLMNPCPKGFYLWQEGLPADAEIVFVNWVYSSGADYIRVVVESASFDVVPPGEPFPELTVLYRRETC